MRDDNDTQNLIKAAQDGDESAFKKLILKYERVMLSVIYPLSQKGAWSDDMLQEARINVWRGLRNFQGTSLFVTYVYSITRNCAYSYRRKLLRDGRYSESLSDYSRQNADSYDTCSPGADTCVELQQTLAAYAARLNLLASKYKDTFILHGIEGKTFAEVSVQLKAPISTVKTWYRHAIAALAA